MMKSRLPRKIPIITGIVVSSGVAVMVFIAVLAVTSPIGAVYSEPGRGFMVFWEQRGGGFSVQNAAGTLEIKAYVINDFKIYLFYALTTQPNPPLNLAQVAAFSSEGGPAPTQPPLNTTQTPPPASPTPDLTGANPLKVENVQTIETFGKTVLGLITLEVSDQSGQLVTLKITAPGDPATSWEVTPLHQIHPRATDQSTTSYLNGYGNSNPYLGAVYSDIMIQSAVGGGAGYIDIYKIFSPSSAAPPLYLQMDHQGNLTPFSRAICPTLFPPYPTNPPRQDGGPVTATPVVPAPCDGGL